MWTYVTIDNDQSVDLEFHEDNRKEILEHFRKWNDDEKRYSDEEVKKLEDALEMLYQCPEKFKVEANVDEVELSEDTIDDCYAEIHDGEETYQDGYDDAMEERERFAKRINLEHGMLMQKLERLAYNYGNPESLTQNEIRKIKDILDEAMNNQ